MNVRMCLTVNCVGCNWPANIYQHAASAPITPLQVHAELLLAEWRPATGGYACSEDCAFAAARDITPASRAPSDKIVSGVSG